MHPSLYDFTLTFLRLGFISFGGPAMVEYLRHTLTVSKKWLDPDTFTKGLATCQSIPGGIVVTLASYCGYQIRGLTGLILAFASFLLPSFLIMLTFSFFYRQSRELSIIKSAFIGLEVVVVAIVINAAIRFTSDRIGRQLPALILSLIAAGLLFLLKTNPMLVIALMACVGMLLYSKASGSPITKTTKAISKGDLWTIITLFALLYFLIYLNYRELFVFSCIMTKIALMSFGGVYTALPLMYHEVVEAKAWMDNKTFMDGIALGQITPGPILINATFVGYVIGGFMGAIIGTFAIFAPGIVLLSLVMPFIGKIESSALFRGATKGIVVAFAGLLIFISLKFTLAVHWDFSKIVFFSAAFGWLLWKNNVLVLSIVGAFFSMLFF